MCSHPTFVPNLLVFGVHRNMSKNFLTGPFSKLSLARNSQESQHPSTEIEVNHQPKAGNVFSNHQPLASLSAPRLPPRSGSRPLDLHVARREQQLALDVRVETVA